MELPLDLKYRPRKFSEVVGNSAVVKLLLTRSKQGTLAGRSMMFGGPKGCGKTTLARITARAIVCVELDSGEPCGECEPCRSVSDESSTSFDEFDAATQGTVDRVRSLIEDLDYGSMDGRPRVIVLDEAHRLSKPSQDALLKAMEDRRLVVILCTTEPRKIVEAIRSRVEEYPVSPPTGEALSAHLKKICGNEGIEFEEEALAITARALAYCPRECVCALDTLRTMGSANVENAASLFKHDRMKLVVDVLSMVDTDPARALSLLDELSVEGATWIRDTMVFAIASAMRQNVGARSQFPFPVSFFPIRGGAWATLAQTLGTLDKPALVDIEACLLASIHTSPASWAATPPTVQSHPVAPTAVSAVVAPVTTPSPVPAPYTPPQVQMSAPAPAPKPVPPPVKVVPKPEPVKHIEVDGVRFTASETLTSLDHKIERGTSGPPVLDERVQAKVEFDQRNVPLSQKEFSNGFLRRVRNS